MIVPNADMDLAPLQQWHLIHAERLGQSHAHVGEPFRVARQEFQQDAFNGLRRRCHLQHAGISALKQLDPLAERHEYYDEKADALNRLAALVATILNPPEGNVVALRR